MHSVFINRGGTLLVSKTEDFHRFSSSVQINIYGSRAVLHTLNGADFYSLLKENAWGPFKALGLDVLYASISDSHMSLMNKALHGVINMKYHGINRVGDLEMNWVEITPFVEEPIVGINLL